MYNLLSRSLQDRYLQIEQEHNAARKLYQESKRKRDHPAFVAIPYVLALLFSVLMTVFTFPPDEKSGYTLTLVMFVIYGAVFCGFTWIVWDRRWRQPRKIRYYENAARPMEISYHKAARWWSDVEEEMMAAEQWHTLEIDWDTITVRERSVQATVLGDSVWLMDLDGEMLMVNKPLPKRQFTQDIIGNEFWLTEQAIELIDAPSNRS